MAYDRNIRKLTKRFGAVGYGVFLRILESIYKVGHFVYCTDEFIFDVLDSLNMDAGEESVIKSIIDYCAEVGLFDHDMYMLSGVLTSHGIQERYFFAKEQSITRAITKQSLPEYEYLLIDITAEFGKPNDISEHKKKQDEGFIGDEFVEVEPIKQAPIMTIVPPQEKKKRESAHHANYDWIAPLYHDCFQEFLDYKRREKKGTYKTESTIRKAYKQLLTLSNNNPIVAKQIVEQSIANGYMGLFPLKNNNNNATNNQHTTGAEKLINGLAAISAANRQSEGACVPERL